MKFLSITALALALGSQAMAYSIQNKMMDFPSVPDTYTPKISAEIRLDLADSDTKNTNVSGIDTETSYSDFTFQTLRLMVKGKLSDELTYVVQPDFIHFPAQTNGKAGAAETPGPTYRDIASPNITFAYVDYTVGDWIVRTGKQAFYSATGWETVYKVSDVYTYSSTFNAYNTNYGYFRSGVSVLKSFGDNNLELSATNSTITTTDTGTIDQANNGMGYGLYYMGSFMDGLIKPNFGYSMFQLDGNSAGSVTATTNATTDTLAAIGVRVTPKAGLDIDVDYDMLTRPQESNATQTQDAKYTTVRAEVRYKFADKFVPFINYFHDSVTGFTTTASYSEDNYDIGIQYYPIKDTDFRYHLVYSNTTINNDSSNPTTSETTNSTIRLGMKLNI